MKKNHSINIFISWLGVKNMSTTFSTLMENDLNNIRDINSVMNSYIDTMWALKTNEYNLVRVIDCHKIVEDSNTLEIHYKNLKNGGHSWDLESDFKKIYKKLGKCKYPMSKLKQMEREYTPVK
jgi:hypothetical protein